MINQAKFERLDAVWNDKERTILMGFSWDKKAGNGDLITNECRRILLEEDISFDAHDNLQIIFEWLEDGLRWGNEFNGHVTTTNHSQTDITKDPWVNALCTAVFLGRYDLIEIYPPPTRPTGDKWKWSSFFLPNEMAWYKALKGERNGYWFWSFFNYFIPVKHTYVMYGFMERAYKQSKKRNNG